MEISNNYKECIIVGICFLISPLYSLPLIILVFRRNPKFAIFLWSVFMGMVGMLYAPTGDIYRYTIVANYLRGLNFKEVTNYCIISNEYILGYLFYLLNSLGLNIDLSRFLYQFIAYLLLGNIYLNILKINKNWEKYKLLLFIIIMPITLSLFLFRFYFSMILLLYGANLIIFRNLKRGWFFIILSVFNHFSYIIFFIGFLFYKTKIFQLNKYSIILFCLLALFIDSASIVNIFNILPDIIVNRYIGYLDGYYAGEYLNNHSLRYKLWIYGTNLISYIGIATYVISYSKKQIIKSSFVNIILIITSFTSLFSVIFNRFLIVLFMSIRIFWGYLFDGKKQLKYIKIIIVTVLISNGLNLWSKRREFMLSDYELMLYETVPQILTHTYSQEWINQHIDANGGYNID